jgi:hypothetical protein
LGNDERERGFASPGGTSEEQRATRKAPGLYEGHDHSASLVSMDEWGKSVERDAMRGDFFRRNKLDRFTPLEPYPALRIHQPLPDALFTNPLASSPNPRI